MFKTKNYDKPALCVSNISNFKYIAVNLINMDVFSESGAIKFLVATKDIV